MSTEDDKFKDLEAAVDERRRARQFLAERISAEKIQQEQLDNAAASTKAARKRLADADARVQKEADKLQGKTS